MSAGLILAAGAGRRFGPEGKLLAPYGDRPLLQHTIDAQVAVAELTRVLIVLGARADRIEAAVADGRLRTDRAETTVCTSWAEGQAASLRHGLALLDGADAVLITLADQPDITPAAIRRVLSAPPGPVRAGYGGRPGHPVRIDRATAARAVALTGDAGARGLLAGVPLVDCSDVADDRDVDTPAALDGCRSVPSDADLPG